MSLKSFVIGSILIHIAVGALIYFYYNPIHLNPQLVEEDLTKELSDDLESKKTLFKKQKPVEASSTPSQDSSDRKDFKSKEGGKQSSLDSMESQEGSLKEFPAEKAQFKEQKKIRSDDKTKKLSETLRKESFETKKGLDESNQNNLIETSLEEKSLEILEPSQEFQEGLNSAEDSKEAAKLKQKKLENTEDSKEAVKLKQKKLENTEDSKEAVKLKQGKLENTKTEIRETGLEIEEESQDSEELEKAKQKAKVKKPGLRERLNLSYLKEKIGFSKNKEKGLKEENKNLKIKKNSLEDFSSNTPSEISFNKLKQKPGNPVLYYPDFARREGMQGHLVVRFFIDENGFVDKLNLEKSSGHSRLDNFILRLLSSYQFKDKNLWVRFDQVFKLEGGEKEFSRLKNRSIRD